MDLRAARLRAVGFAVIASVVILMQIPVPAAAAEPATSDLAARIVADAESHLGAPYRWGSTGPGTFDCSGLVYRVFEETGLFSRIGSGRYRTATQMYAYFRARGLASRTGGEVGDLVIWGGGSHIGIYLGGGRAISALVDGVRIHGIDALMNQFTAFLHTELGSGIVTSASALAARASATSRSAALTTTATNVRRGPGTRYARVALVPAGTRLSVLRTALDTRHRAWYLVRLPSGHSGWVASWLIRR